MATATESVKECRVCAHVYVNPKLLSCHHSLCEACVHKLKKGLFIECPTCRKTCPISELVSDFRLEEFLQAFREKDEELAQIVSGTTLKAGADFEKCHVCTKKEVSHYCKDCEQWICFECKAVHVKFKISRDHRIITLSDKLKTVKTQLGEKIEILQQQLNHYNSSIETLQYKRTQFIDMKRKTLVQSRTLREKYLQEVNERFDDIDNQILTLAEEHIEDMDIENEHFKRELDKIQKEFDISMKTMQEESIRVALGGEEIISKLESILSGYKPPVIQTMDIELVIKQEKSWKAQSSVVLDVAKQPIKPIVSFSNLWKQNTQIRIKSHEIGNLRFIGSNIWQCCCSDGIDIYTPDLDKIRHISARDMGSILDVVDCPQDKVIVAASNGLYLLSSLSKVHKQLADGQFSGVVRNKELVFAARCNKKGAVHVFKPTNSGFEQQFQFRIECQKGRTVSLAIFEDNIYVCPSTLNRIEIYTAQGQHLCRIDSAGPNLGMFKNPRLGSVDVKDCLLIADSENDRVLIMNGNDQWRELTMQPKSSAIHAALMVDGKLYIYSEDERKLIKYI